MTVDWFEYQMTVLCAEGLRCIGYDRRGHGRSDEPGHGYDFTAALIAGSKLIVYENAGHALPITHMDRLNRDLLAFITA